MEWYEFIPIKETETISRIKLNEKVSTEESGRKMKSVMKKDVTMLVKRIIPSDFNNSFNPPLTEKNRILVAKKETHAHKSYFISEK